MRRLRLLFSLMICLGAGVAFSAEKPRVVAVRAQGPVQIDAVLDEPDWERAQLVDDLRTPEPVAGAPFPFETQVRILYDSDTLYIGVVARDPEPSKIRSEILRRDVSLRSQDRFNFAIDPFGEGRTGFFFSSNPNAARLDGLIEDGGGINLEWDGIWYADARVDETGWYLEVAIPFKTLNFDPDHPTWGVNFERIVPRVNLQGRFTAAEPAYDIFNTHVYGELAGLEGLDQGLGLDLVPFIALRDVRDKDQDRLYSKADPGVDIFYKITPSMTSTITVNTDFSDAPPDERQTNLTRFGLFFPERRDFFLQDAGIFRFAEFGTQTSRRTERRNGNPFFSRRIALAADGPLDIRTGGKLTGRAGPVTLGLLGTRVEGHDGINGKWLSAGRASVRTTENSSVGFIGTYGDPDRNAHNKVVGADYNYQSSEFLGNRRLDGSLWVQRSSTSGLDDKNGAWGARLTYPNDRWFWDVSAVGIQENFNPALGFVNRAGIREYRGQLRRRWRPHEDYWFRTYDMRIVPTITTGVDNRLHSVRLEIDPLFIDTTISDTFWLRGIYRHEDLDMDFEIRPGIIIPQDRYRMERVQFYLDTSRNRPFEFAVRLEYGRFFTGTSLETTFNFDWRVNKHVTLGGDYIQFLVRLPEGNFTTRIARFNADLAFSNRVFWTNLIQWDNESQLLNWNSRLRWIVEPGREVILVLDPSKRRDRRLQFDATRTESVLKLVWTQRY